MYIAAVLAQQPCIFRLLPPLQVSADTVARAGDDEGGVAHRQAEAARAAREADAAEAGVGARGEAAADAVAGRQGGASTSESGGLVGGHRDRLLDNVNWDLVSQEMGSRNAMQCRYTW